MGWALGPLAPAPDRNQSQEKKFSLGVRLRRGRGVQFQDFPGGFLIFLDTFRYLSIMPCFRGTDLCTVVCAVLCMVVTLSVPN